MEKKKVGAIALGTVAAGAATGAAIYVYKKRKQKKIQDIYSTYELNHGNSANYEGKEVESFEDDSVKKHIMKRGK